MKLPKIAAVTLAQLAFASFVVLGLASSACSARRSEPVAGPLPQLDAQQQRGQYLFMHTCNPCHPQGEAGLGGGLNAKPFPAPAIKAKVRTALGGEMPTFNSTELSDDQLDDIIAFMKVLRKQ